MEGPPPKFPTKGSVHQGHADQSLRHTTRRIQRVWNQNVEMRQTPNMLHFKDEEDRALAVDSHLKTFPVQGTKNMCYQQVWGMYHVWADNLQSWRLCQLGTVLKLSWFKPFKSICPTFLIPYIFLLPYFHLHSRVFVHYMFFSMAATRIPIHCWFYHVLTCAPKPIEACQISNCHECPHLAY